MIRKPPADWQRPDEGRPVRAARAAVAVAKGSVTVAWCGVNVVRGLVCYFFAAMWGFLAIAIGPGGSLPGFMFMGAGSAFMLWAGHRAFAKARATSL
jgi:hypothetical protein